MSALLMAGNAAAVATTGGAVSMNSGQGSCSDSRIIPQSTAQDVFVLGGATACAGGSASADIKGDAASASIGLKASASGSAGGSSQTAASVSLRDFWDISVAAGTPSGSITIPVTLQLDGSISPGAVFNPGFGRFLDYSLNFGQPFSFNVFQATGRLTTVGNYSQSFSGSIVLPYSAGRPLRAVVELSMSVPGLLEGSIDFYNTASVSLQLPAGYVVTNSSGTQLFAAPVPEPASIMMMMSGLALVAGLSRARPGRRHR
ncbi:PEP-CTERM sorting domain-containing protein [Methyloversatilis sp. RAC08]|uniref:PEP-CTERM sorting domain-containing protein n=1 Tax=Methyloversatilis sp. RAC08 TaxID=1842540 RepID=UPI0012375031|nr:PEP-CTERM sorting domain-containing protein [Methyloversatilis sp. RAC08]